MLSPDLPQVGVPPEAVTPVPPRDTELGEFVASLVTVMLPVTSPVAAGAKVTFTVTPCPGVRICPADRPLALKPAPESTTFDTVTLEFPLLVKVVACMLLAPTLIFPKDRLVGLALSRWVAAFTVRVAALLVALPAELLTTTLSCAPVSAVVSAGVV